MKVTHVKPHGALNKMAHIAAAIAHGIKAANPELIFVANACSEMVAAGLNAGLKVAEEAYVDRTYDETGAMTSRSLPNAIIHDPKVAAAQVLRFVRERAVFSASGKRFPSRIRTFCTHGDEPTAVALAREVKAELEAQGVEIVPLTDMQF